MEKAKAECCTDLPSEWGCRNNYFDGKRLTTDSFRIEQRYFRERRQLLNRAIHGWGVVYGFEITSAAGRLKIGPGLALDECGRELLQDGTRQVGLDDLLMPDEKSTRRLEHARTEDTFSPGPPVEEPVCWLLSAHYAEQSTGPIKVEDSCHCEHEEFERTCETVRYSLRRIPCDECCRPFECELDCKCASGPCCDEDSERKPPGRGGCRCLCDHLTALQPGAEECALTEIEDPCGRVQVDLRNGVPLACIRIVRDEYDCWTIDPEIEPCGPRRLVKRNDLLFDLIRGCDLTRIKSYGWSPWHRRAEPVPFEDFSKALGQNDHEGKFWVRFSRPVRIDTLLPDAFAMTVLSGEKEGGWWQILRVPIVDVQTRPATGDPDGHASEARIVFDSYWLEDAVRGYRTIFIGYETWIEIEVRGGLIVDCNGQMLDADGNATPGGTFLSTFRVAARPYATADRGKGASS